MYKRQPYYKVVQALARETEGEAFGQWCQGCHMPQQVMNGLLPQRDPDTAWLEFGRHIASQARSADAYWQGRGELLAKPNDLACLFGVTLDASSSGRHTELRPAVCATALPAEVATLLASRARDLGVTAGLLAQYAWHRLLLSLIHI